MSELDASDGRLELAVIGRVWRFGRGDGSLIASGLRFRRGGEVSGHSQRNESAWRVHDGKLEFLSDKGAITCRFESIGFDARGLMTLQGEFRGKAGITHVLQETRRISQLGQRNVDPKVALLVRTHLVNEKLFDLLDVLNQSRRYDLFVLADETRGPLETRGYAKLTHSVDMVSRYGLSHRHPNVLWHCGDYPLYFAAAEIPGYDYYGMIEYDVDLVRRSPLFLEGLISRLCGDRGSVDFVSAGTGRAEAQWGWTEAASRIFPVVYTTGLFAFLIVSQRAIDCLIAARRKEARSGAAGADIVHCEAFCVSALMEAGLACAPINSLVEHAVNYATFHPGSLELPDGEFLLNDYRIDDPRVEMVHPVYDLSGYLERHYRRALRNNDFSVLLKRLSQGAPSSRPTETNLFARYKELVLARIGGGTHQAAAP